MNDLDKSVFKEAKYKGSTSRYFIDNDKKYFIKFPVLFKEYDILKREILILKKLKENNIDWCPDLIFYDNEKLVTNYCGETINETNIPDDYEKQISKIISDLNNLNIKHNDIWFSGKPPEFLVKDGKIYLVDFGWASINDDFSCGDENISNKVKPYGIYNDYNSVFKYLKNLKNEKMKKNMLYYDSKRKVGSQSEIPKVKLGQNGNIKYAKVTGYQNFCLENNNIMFINKRDKFNKIEKVLKSIYSEEDIKNKTLTDIGCSSGLSSFIANRLGYNKIYSIDHDPEYLEIIIKICKHLNIKNIETNLKKFGNDFKKTDIVLMLAIIHWIFSCTSLYGSFDLIFQKIKDKVGEYLLIEWVDPKDPAITMFNHISYNQNILKEDYTVENFESSILRNFSSIKEKVVLDGNTRVLYIIKK